MNAVIAEPAPRCSVKPARQRGRGSASHLGHQPASPNQLDDAGNAPLSPRDRVRDASRLRTARRRPHAIDAVAGHGVRRVARDGSGKQTDGLSAMETPPRGVSRGGASFAARSDCAAGTIEHFGNTAVPGLAAKPVIDIMVGVETLDASRPAIAALEQFGYRYFPYRPDQVHCFCKPSPALRTHHLHLVPHGSRYWIEQLAFRDYLRAHPEVAAGYADLKFQLAKRYAHSREAYTDAKGPFVKRIVELALGRGSG